MVNYLYYIINSFVKFTDTIALKLMRGRPNNITFDSLNKCIPEQILSLVYGNASWLINTLSFEALQYTTHGTY